MSLGYKRFSTVREGIVCSAIVPLITLSSLFLYESTRAITTSTPVIVARAASKALKLSGVVDPLGFKCCGSNLDNTILSSGTVCRPVCDVSGVSVDAGCLLMTTVLGGGCDVWRDGAAGDDRAAVPCTGALADSGLCAVRVLALALFGAGELVGS